MIDFDKHPARIIGLLQDRYGEDITFEFSRYIHSPQQLFDKRETFELVGQEVSGSQVMKIIQSLSADEELAMHSRVRRRGRNYHIPMIDFVSNDWTRELESEIRKYTPRNIYRQLQIFSSGRSYHAYGICLLEPREWLDFMGRLLLINPPTSPEFVDTRWVGHRLIGGFSSLRWSCNTSQYKKYPEFLDDAQRIRIISNGSTD